LASDDEWSSLRLTEYLAFEVRNEISVIKECDSCDATTDDGEHVHAVRDVAVSLSLVDHECSLAICACGDYAPAAGGVQSPRGKESGYGISSCEPCRYGRHLELDVCPQESYQGGNVSALECVNVSVKDVLKLGFDRIEELVFWPDAAFELGPGASERTIDGVGAGFKEFGDFRGSPGQDIAEDEDGPLAGGEGL